MNKKIEELLKEFADEVEWKVREECDDLCWSNHYDNITIEDLVEKYLKDFKNLLTSKE